MWEDKLVIINFITVVERDIKAGRFGIPNFQRDGNMVSKIVSMGRNLQMLSKGEQGAGEGCMGWVTRQGQQQQWGRKKNCGH